MSLRGLPTPEPDEFIDRRRMAEILGISVSAFDKMRAAALREGDPCPCEDWGLRAVRFDPAKTIAWARRRATRLRRAA